MPAGGPGGGTVPPGPLTWGPNRLPVPVAAAWSAETLELAPALTIHPHGTGLAYRAERPGDRDRHGVLWLRCRDTPGQGRPQFRAMHPARQRAAMLNRLCQVCAGPASRTSRGWLFLVQHTETREQPADWPDGVLCTKPPICLPCAALALRHCPHLTEPVAIRSRKPRVWGVFGGHYLPTTDNRLTQVPDDAYLSYGSPTAPWFVAQQLVVELQRCTVIDLVAELAAA